MPLVPSFEFKTNELRSLVTAPGIYQCLLDNEILYIGESNNLSRRIKEHLRDETMSFDEVRYSVMNGISDDERRKWEIGTGCQIAAFMQSLYSQRTVNIQSTDSQHTVNTQSTSTEIDVFS